MCHNEDSSNILHSSSAAFEAQVQRFRKTSPIRDIPTVQVETLIKDKEGQHEGDGDKTSLLNFIHDPAILTELALQIDQLKEQLQKTTTVPFAKVYTVIQ